MDFSSIQQKAAPIGTNCSDRSAGANVGGKKVRLFLFDEKNKILEFSLAHTAHSAQLYPNPEMFSRSKNTRR